MNAYDKIRAALELAREYIQDALNNERAAYKGHESISNIGEMNADMVRNRNAFAALADTRIAELEADAARYRWLRQGSTNGPYIVDVDGCAISGEDADEDVDAARAGNGGVG